MSKSSKDFVYGLDILDILDLDDLGCAMLCPSLFRVVSLRDGSAWSCENISTAQPTVPQRQPGAQWPSCPWRDQLHPGDAGDAGNAGNAGNADATPINSAIEIWLILFMIDSRSFDHRHIHHI